MPHVLETMNLPGYVTSEVICSTVHAHHDVFSWPHDTFIRSYIVKVTQLCPTLCDSMDYTALGILQARILEWEAFPFSRGSSQPRDLTQVSRIAGRFLASCAKRKAQFYSSMVILLVSYVLF